MNYYYYCWRNLRFVPYLVLEQVGRVDICLLSLCCIQLNEWKFRAKMFFFGFQVIMNWLDGEINCFGLPQE